MEPLDFNFAHWATGILGTLIGGIALTGIRSASKRAAELEAKVSLHGQTLAADKAEIENIKTALNRIEAKVDRLLERL